MLVAQKRLARARAPFTASHRSADADRKGALLIVAREWRRAFVKSARRVGIVIV
jgi:hypothetical protein